MGPSLSTPRTPPRSEEHTSELQSQFHLVCRLLLEKKKELLIGAYVYRREACLRVSYAYCSWPSGTGVGFYYFFVRYMPAFALHFFFFFNDTATTEIYTLSLHDALPI